MGDSDVSRRLAYSRWRRLPGVFRSGERRQIGPGDDPERLTLYLPARELDLATELATEAGFPSTQAYCEALIRQALQDAAEERRVRGHPHHQDPNPNQEDDGPRSSALDGLDAIANDPEYLTEWSQSRAPRDEKASEPILNTGPLPPEFHPDTDADDDPVAFVTIPQPVEVRLDDLEEPFRLVLHHAALNGEPPPALLASLRAGIAVEPDVAHELIGALETLQDCLHGTTVLDRRLAFALHRLALESQMLLTETWPGLASDPLQVEILRQLQERVDALFADDGPNADPDANMNPSPQE